MATTRSNGGTGIRRRSDRRDPPAASRIATRSPTMSQQDTANNAAGASPATQQEATTEGSTRQQGSRPANNEERHGTALDKGDTIAGVTTGGPGEGGQGEFGSHAP